MIQLSPKHKKVLSVFSWIALVLIIMFLFITRFMVYLGPFILALGISLIIIRPVDFIQAKLKIKRGIVTFAVLISFLVVAFGTIGLILYGLINELVTFGERILLGGELEEFLTSFFERLRLFYINLPDQAVLAIEDSISSMAMQIGYQTQNLMQSMVDLTFFLPRIIIFIVISIISAFFMTKDKERVLRFISKQLPQSWKMKLEIVAKELARTILIYIKAQFITSSISMVFIFAGYELMGFEYALLFAVFTTLFDAMPVLGAGLVLGISALVQVIMGDILRGIGFIVIYLIVLIIRNTVEPKVIGKGVGIHPLLILLSMYAGLQIVGGFGLILGPIFVITLKALQKAELLPQWKK